MVLRGEREPAVGASSGCKHLWVGKAWWWALGMAALCLGTLVAGAAGADHNDLSFAPGPPAPAGPAPVSAAVVDLNGDGRDDIVANDNGRVTPQNPNPTPGVHVFFAPADAATGEWTYRRIEDKAAMNSCVAADINGDKKPDLVCTGAGGVIRWYENTGQRKTGSEK